MPAIETFKQAQFCFLDFSGRRAPLEICHGLIARDYPCPLMHSREKVRIPDLSSGIGQLRCEHHKRRQVLILCSETVAHPRPQAWPFEGDRSRVNTHRCLKMVIVVAVHRIDHTYVVNTLADIREEFACHNAALTARLELPHRSKKRSLAFV